MTSSARRAAFLGGERFHCPVTVNVPLVAPAAMFTVAGDTVNPGEPVKLDDGTAVVATATGAEYVTVQKSCSPGSTWKATAPGTLLVSGAHAIAKVGVTLIVPVEAALDMTL